MACAAAAVHKKKPQSRLLALLALSWACLQTAQPVRALAGPTVRAALFDPRTPAFWLSRCSSRPSTSSSISTGPHRQLRPLRVSPRRAVQASEPSESEDDKDKIVASARDEQLQKTAQEKEDKGFDKSTEKETLLQKLLEMAVKTWDGAQKDLDGAREDRDFARQRLREAVQNGDEKERKEAREEFEKAKGEFEKAKGEFEKAKEEAKRAESKVQAAKEEATKAREELEKAKSTAPLQDWCGRLLQKKLTFGPGTPLLSTIGADWDYCGKEDLVKDMRASVQELHEKKGRGEDKQAHPLFIAFAGPGQGKSRLLTEFPGLVAECLKDLKNRRFSDKPLAFLLTCENGLGPGDWRTEELSARRFVACRMLWQLRKANQQQFNDAGAPTNFAKFRAGCAADLVPEDVFGLVLPPDQRSFATVVIGLDGMQNLPGFAQRGEQTGKDEPFYQVIQEVCRLVMQDTPPFVVACVTATQSVSQALADSPQARQYLKLPRVTAVTRQQVAAIPHHDLKDLLTMDMGGHGRALECLEETLKDSNMSASALVGAVMSSLSKKYPNAARFKGASAKDVLDLLRASLSGKVFRENQTVGGLDPAKMELIRVVYLDTFVAEYRIDIPYIWLQLMLSQQMLTSDLDPWKLSDYGLFEKPAARTWQAWEQFNAEFRVLRSRSFEDGQAVKIGLLHRGAIIRPHGFEDQEVVNRHLTLAEAKGRLSSRASCCGHPKPYINSNDNKPAKGLKKFQCRVTLAGKDVVVSMDNKNMLVINGASAPAADAFLMLGKLTAGNEKLISECQQVKMGSGIVNETVERSKACDNDDILVLLLNRAAVSPQSQNRLVFVSANQAEAYFGLYAGRAFLLMP